MIRSFPLSLPVLLGLVSLASSARAAGPSADDFFESHIRPLLVEHCIQCHGPTAQKGGLRLDTRDALIKGGDGGAIVSITKPESSRMLSALHHERELQMPPGKKLDEVAIDKFAKWISLGLPWPARLTLLPPDRLAKAAKDHWAFRPVTTPALPPVKAASWCRNEVDRLVLAKLEQANLKPSVMTDRRTLIRRLSFDLIGLPPTSAEIEAFTKDSSPDAYARLVDRLLASPAYGERWGRHWLDVARYADTKGYVFFEDKRYPWAWTYRDYVIQSLNDDKPYDRFLQEQLAADKLGDPAALPALGFLTVGGHFMNNTHDILDDRIDVITRGLMGLTVSCARCHDHKFDPIPQTDYYSLYGVLRSSYEPTVPPLAGPVPATEEYRTFAAGLSEREAKLQNFVTGKHRRLVSQARTRVAEYLLAAHFARDKPADDDFMLLADKNDLNPTIITRFRNFLEQTRSRRDPLWQAWHRFTAIPEKDFATRADETAAEVRRESGDRLIRTAFATPPISMTDVAARYAHVLQMVARQWQDAVEVPALTGEPVPAGLLDPALETWRRILYGPQAPPDVPLELDWGFLSLFPDRETQNEYKKLLKEVETWMVKGPPRAMVLLDSERPHAPRVFQRGQPNRLGESVPRQFLQVANPLRRPFVNGSGRLELAREITSTTNPLTARVFVNRVWMLHFGRGLVGTPGDFGLRSDPPSHSELLDWLAADFVANGWSIKRLHKQIVLSATYQQSSASRPDVVAVDPENRLYGRANRRRLELEALHDSLLAVSGSLVLKQGGPSVTPFTAGRRAVYWSIDRLDFPPTLATFDVPSPAASNPQRTFTTVAPQALYLMNASFVRTAAAKLIASKPIASQQAPTVKVEALFLAVLGRRPDKAELDLATTFVALGPERWVDLAHGLMMTNEFAFVD